VAPDRTRSRYDSLVPTPARSPVALALLGAALTACSGLNVCRIPAPALPTASPPVEPAPLRIAVAFEPAEALTLAVHWDNTWVFPLGPPLRGAFEAVASELSRPPDGASGAGAGMEPDAILAVHVRAFRVALPNVPGRIAELDVESTLRTRSGEVLATVRAPAASPRDRPFAFPSCEVFEDAAAAAVRDAAVRTRAALATAPRVAALRAAPAGWTSPAPPPEAAGAKPGPSPPGTTPDTLPLIDLRPRIEQFSDLRWPAERDPLVKAQVDRIASRRSAGATLAGIGGASGVLAILLAVGWKETYYYPPPPDARRWTRYPEAAAILGVTAAVSLVAALAVWPSRETWREPVDLWNARHPDEPLELATPPAPPVAAAPDP
jgi:hypothetical protein